MLCYILILAILCFEPIYGRGRFVDRGDSVLATRHRSWLVPAALVAVQVALFAVQALIVWFLAKDNHLASASHGFPIKLTGDRGNISTPRRWAASEAMLPTVALQVFFLYCFHRLLTRHVVPSALWCISAASLAMLTIGVCTTAVTSGDMYAYVGDALLGSRAYDPPAVPFANEYAGISTWWHVPMAPTPYGPLWVWYNHALIGTGSSLAAKLLILRLAGVFWLAVAVGCVALITRSFATTALVVLNPALIWQFVANAHNDVIGIVLILLAVLAGRTLPFVQVPLIVAAALVKLPFIVVGVAALEGSRRTRLALALATLSLAAILSRLSGGQAYLAALRYHTDPRSLTAPHLFVAVAAVCVAAIALVLGQRAAGAAFTFAGVAMAIFPWYAAWGLPYAVRARTAPAFLIALPVICFLFETNFHTLWFLFAAIAFLTAAAVREIPLRAARRRQIPNAA